MKGIKIPFKVNRWNNTILLSLLITVPFLSIQAQHKTNIPLSQLEKVNDDSVRAVLLNDIAQEYLKLHQFDEAVNYANKSIAISKNGSKNYTAGLTILAEVNATTKKYAVALDYLIQIIRVYEKQNDNYSLTYIYYKTGKLYMDWGVYEKALEYFLKSHQLMQAFSETEFKTEIIRDMGFSYLQIKDYGNALKYYKELQGIYQNVSNKKELLSTTIDIAEIYLYTNNYEEALKYNLEILKLNEQLDDPVGVAKTLNNIGSLYKYLNEYKTAIKYFEQAIRFEELLPTGNPGVKAVLYNNIGVLYQLLSDYQYSITYFERAIQIRENENESIKAAEAYNRMAISYYSLGKKKEAESHILSAIELAKRELAKSKNANEVLVVSYKTLSKIYEGNDNKKALYYHQLYATIKEKLFNEEIASQEELYQKQFDVEKKEKEIKLLMVDRELSSLAIKEFQLEAEKKNKEVELLSKEKELQGSLLENQQLEKEKAIHELILAKNEIEVEKKDNEITLLQKDKAIQDLELKKRNLEKEEKQKAIKLLEKDKKLKEHEIEEEATVRKYFMWLSGLLSIISLLIVGGLFLSRKANRILKVQKEEIGNKNEELQQQQEEILAQRNYIEKTNKELEKQYTSIKKSYTNMSVISQVGHEITSTLDFKKAINNIYEYVNTMMDASEFRIGVYEAQLERISFVLHIYKSHNVENYFVPLNEPFFSTWVVKNNKMLMTWNGDRAVEYMKYINDPLMDKEVVFNSLICIPLEIEDKVIGVVSVQSHNVNAYSEYHSDILRTLGTYIAAALNNANAYQLLEYKVKERTKELRSAYTSLVKANKQFDRFAYRSAHDLKGPLARLLGLCYVGKLEVSEPKSIEYLEKLETTASEMNNMLSRLIRAHDINNQPLEINEINVREELDGIIKKLMTNGSTYEDVKISVNASNNLIIISDQALFNIMLENLILNALQYRDRDKPQKTLNIRAKQNQKSQLNLSIEDNGVGVPDTYKFKIFDMFFIGTELSKGPGLGLYEAKLIAKKLKGELALNHSNQNSTEFQVSLPIS